MFLQAILRAPKGPIPPLPAPVCHQLSRSLAANAQIDQAIGQMLGLLD